MNNEKIGKFIAKLRKAKHLTQQQLGDLVGVGGKSVSKWERGINMPDVSIINEVSKVLGITSNELLNGEFDKNSSNELFLRKKNQKKNIFLIFILLLLSIIAATISFFYFKNDTHKYWISSADKDYSAVGTIEYNKKGYKINVDNIYCDIEECKNSNIDKIEYYMVLNDVVVYKNNMENTESKSVNEYLDGKVIYVDDKYSDSIISYNDMKNSNIDMILFIEVNKINEEFLAYKINLRIDDKEM